MRTKGSVIHFKSRRKPWIFVVKRWNLKISDKEFSMYLFHLVYESLNHKLSNEIYLRNVRRYLPKRALDSHCLEIWIWNFWIWFFYVLYLLHLAYRKNSFNLQMTTILSLGLKKLWRSYHDSYQEYHALTFQ